MIAQGPSATPRGQVLNYDIAPRRNVVIQDLTPAARLRADHEEDADPAVGADPGGEGEQPRQPGRGGGPHRVDQEDDRADGAREGEPERAPARGPAIAGRAQDEAGDRAARLRGGDEEPGADLVEAERLDREERQVAQ